MTEKLNPAQLEKVHTLLRDAPKRQPKYRYKRGPYGWNTSDEPNGWHKIEVATGEIVAKRCNICEPTCRKYFPIPPSMVSDD